MQLHCLRAKCWNTAWLIGYQHCNAGFVTTFDNRMIDTICKYPRFSICRSSQIHPAYAEAKMHLEMMKKNYESTENRILNPDNASHDSLRELLTTFKHQKAQLKETQKSIAKLYEDQVQVLKK